METASQKIFFFSFYKIWARKLELMYLFQLVEWENVLNVDNFWKKFSKNFEEQKIIFLYWCINNQWEKLLKKFFFSLHDFHARKLELMNKQNQCDNIWTKISKSLEKQKKNHSWSEASITNGRSFWKFYLFILRNRKKNSFDFHEISSWKFEIDAIFYFWKSKDSDDKEQNFELKSLDKKFEKQEEFFSFYFKFCSKLCLEKLELSQIYLKIWKKMDWMSHECQCLLAIFFQILKNRKKFFFSSVFWNLA